MSSIPHHQAVLRRRFSPLIAQTHDRAGMMVSPNGRQGAGDKSWPSNRFARALQIVERVQQDRIVAKGSPDLLEQGPTLHRSRGVLPIVDATVRLANLKSGGLDLIERVLATDIKEVRATSG